MIQFRNFLYDKNRILKTVIILLIVNCLTTYGFIIRQKRDVPAEAAAVAAPAAAEAAKVVPAAEAAKAVPAAEAAKAPPPCASAPAANPISGPMNAAAAQMTAAVQPFMTHMDKLGTEGAEFMKKGFEFGTDLFNPMPYFIGQK